MSGIVSGLFEKVNIEDLDQKGLNHLTIKVFSHNFNNLTTFNVNT